MQPDWLQHENGAKTCLLVPFVAGRYSATYDPQGAIAAADIGIMERGYELQVQFSKKLITNTDAYGDSVIDAVLRGGNCHWQGTCEEWMAGILNAAFPYNTAPASATPIAFAPTGVSFLGPGTGGRLDSNVAGILIATAQAGTPAAAAPATLTATYAAIAENFDIRMFFGLEERKIPFRFRLYVYSDTNLKWFSTT